MIMPIFQNVKYKVIADTSKGEIRLDRYFLGGNSSQIVNDVPTAVLNFSDKDRRLSDIPDGYLAPTESFWIMVSASTNSGEDWKRILVGMVEDYNINLGADGKRQITLNLYECPEFRYNYITPNQIAIGNCDFGELFTGSATASDGTPWNPDSLGNYPNGLLYDTSLSFQSTPDFYAGVPDVPFRTVYNNSKKIDVIKKWMNNYGLMFWIDSRYGYFYIQNEPAVQTFPFSGQVVEVGKTVNKYSKTINLTGFKSTVTLIGSDTTIFDTYGGGHKESLILDSEILSIRAAREMAKRNYTSSIDMPKNYTAIIPPTTVPLLGKSILFTEVDGDSETLSVVGVTQNFGDRWETQLQFERPSYSDAKTIIQIQDELASQSQEDLQGQAYIRLTSGESTYHRNEGSAATNICAIGLGHTADTDSGGVPLTDSGMESPIIISPVFAVITDSFESKPYYSAYTTIPNTEANQLIREVTLFANDYVNNEPYHHYRTVPINGRPVSEWNNGCISTVYRSLSKCEDNYLISIEKIYPVSTISECVAFPRTAKDLNVKYINEWTNSINPPAITATVDGVAGTGDNIWTKYSREPDADNISAMSRDMRNSSWNYSVASFSNVTGSGSGKVWTGKDIFVLFEFDMPVTPVSEAYKYIERIDFGFHTWASYSYFGGFGHQPVLLYWYNASSSLGDQNWFCFGTISDNDGCYFYSGSLYPSQSFTPTMPPTTPITINRRNLVDTDSGKFYMALRVASNSSYAGATSTLYVQYAAITANLKGRAGSGGTVDIHRFDKCMIDETGYIQLPFQPKSIQGIYASADYSAFSDSWVKQETATNLFPPLEYRKKYDALQIFKPKKKAKYQEGGGQQFRGTKPKTKYEYWDWSDPVYLYQNANPDEKPLKSVYGAILINRYVFVEYTSEFVDADVSSPPEIPINVLSVSFSNRGKDAYFYMDYSVAPAGYWSNLGVSYSAVGSGTNLAKGGTIGKAIFCLNTGSSLREGVDKNIYKTFNIQYDWYGGFPQEAGSSDGNVGGGNIHEHPHIRGKPGEWWTFETP